MNTVGPASLRVEQHKVIAAQAEKLITQVPCGGEEDAVRPLAGVLCLEIQNRVVGTVVQAALS